MSWLAKAVARANLAECHGSTLASAFDSLCDTNEVTRPLADEIVRRARAERLSLFEWLDKHLAAGREVQPAQIDATRCCNCGGPLGLPDGRPEPLVA